MPRVLVVEDEPVLRGSLARGLRKFPALEVVEAANLVEALAAIDAAPPTAIVSDIDLPGRSGLELIGELRRRGLVTPVLFVSAYLKAYRSQIPPNAQVTVLEKPVPLEEIRRWVTGQLAAAHAGRAPFCAADYLQLAGMGRHSIEILVAAGRGGPGRIVVVDGELWSAVDGAGAGVAAFKRCAFHQGGEVECRSLHGDPGPRDIEVPWESLLLDAAREADEEARDGRREEAVAAPAGQAAVDAFSACWDRGIAALLEKDYPGALAAFVEAKALRPDDARVAANLKRLAELGHAERADTER